MLEIKVSHVINASAAALYDVVADYRVGHNAIVPRPYFSDLVVEEGGYGEGTVISFTITVAGQTVEYRQRASEPEKGRIIQEANLHDSGITQFIFDPIDNDTTKVTIYIQMEQPTGAFAFLERWINIAFSKRLFKKELQNLAEYVANEQTRSSSAVSA